MIGCSRAHREINGGGYQERPVTTQPRVRYVGAKDGGDPDGADPVGDVVGGGDCVLMQVLHQVIYQVR